MGIRNFTVTAGGVAQDILPERFGRSRIIIEPQDEGLWANFGATAAANVGEWIASGSSAQFTVEGFPEIGGRLSIFSATTGSDIVIREA